MKRQSIDMKMKRKIILSVSNKNVKTKYKVIPKPISDKRSFEVVPRVVSTRNKTAYCKIII